MLALTLQTWRRRCIELKDGQLLSKSEVSQQTYALIELSEVASVEDLNTRGAPLATSETSETLADGGGGDGGVRRPTHRRVLSDTDEREARLAVVERSFRLNFRDAALEPVDFYADSDADKALWLRTLARALKDVPPRWAMAMRAREDQRMAASASAATLTASATTRSLASPPGEGQPRPKSGPSAIRRPPPPRA